MPFYRRALSISLLTIVASWSPHDARAQSILERVKKLGQNTATAGKKAVVDEANGQINSAVQDAATQRVADGQFIAVLSPWSSTDAAKRVELARFSGDAFVVTTPTSRQIIVCDTKGVQSWLASFTILNSAAPSTAVAGGGAVSGHASGGGGGAAGHAGGGGAAGHAGGGGAAGHASGGAGAAPKPSGGGAPSADDADSSESGAGKGSDKTPSSPFTAIGQSYSFPSTQVTISLPASGGAQSGKPSKGSITIGEASQTVLTGEAKVRFSQATIPGEKGPQTVDLGMAFKARVMSPGDSPVGCEPNASKTAGGKTAGGKTAGGKTEAPTALGEAPGNPAAAPEAAHATGPTFAEGDVLVPKIDNVKLLAAASDGAKETATVKMGDALVYLGQEDNGYVHVQGSAGEGWVRKALLNKR